jgi:hypothetical protein
MRQASRDRRVRGGPNTALARWSARYPVWALAIGRQSPELVTTPLIESGSPALQSGRVVFAMVPHRGRAAPE